MANVATKSPPPNWPRISSSAVYAETAKAIDWLCTAFGFEVRLRVDGEGGRVDHCELEIGGGVVMIGDGNPARDISWRKSPRQLGGACTQSMMVYVDDVDAHCAHARAHGAVIANEPTTTDYGEDYWTDRSYEAIDLEGHHWWFAQRIK